MIHLDVTLRKSDEIEALEEECAQLRAKLEQKDREIAQMASYAELSLRYADQLREARRLLQHAGLEHSFIQI